MELEELVVYEVILIIKWEKALKTVPSTVLDFFFYYVIDRTEDHLLDVIHRRLCFLNCLLNYSNIILYQYKLYIHLRYSIISGKLPIKRKYVSLEAMQIVNSLFSLGPSSAL